MDTSTRKMCTILFKIKHRNNLKKKEKAYSIQALMVVGAYGGRGRKLIIRGRAIFPNRTVTGGGGIIKDSRVGLYCNTFIVISSVIEIRVLRQEKQFHTVKIFVI